MFTALDNKVSMVKMLWMWIKKFYTIFSQYLNYAFGDLFWLHYSKFNFDIWINLQNKYFLILLIEKYRQSADFPFLKILQIVAKVWHIFIVCFNNSMNVIVFLAYIKNLLNAALFLIFQNNIYTSHLNKEFNTYIFNKFVKRKKSNICVHQ